MIKGLNNDIKFVELSVNLPHILDNFIKIIIKNFIKIKIKIIMTVLFYPVYLNQRKLIDWSLIII